MTIFFPCQHCDRSIELRSRGQPKCPYCGAQQVVVINYFSTNVPELNAIYRWRFVAMIVASLLMVVTQLLGMNPYFLPLVVGVWMLTKAYRAWRQGFLWYRQIPPYTIDTLAFRDQWPDVFWETVVLWALVGVGMIGFSLYVILTP